MTNLFFAQLSDIHISDLGDHHDMLSGRSAGFLQQLVADLNRLEALDFVLITGDLFDTASERELARFQQIISALTTPYYVIPGNHDRREVAAESGLTRHQFARLFNPQLAERPAAPEAQVGYWSLAIAPEVQLIGLDSVKDDDWSGVIDAPQLRWLEAELITHAEKLIIVAIHHPLHKLAPIDDHPVFWRFVLENGQELQALFDRHPQVRLVLTGHHHVTQAGWLGERLHLACPAVAVYPCAYRLLRLSRGDDQRWQVEWQTRPAANPLAGAEAEKLMLDAWQEAGFAEEFIAEYAAIAWGSDLDRRGTALL